MKTPWKGVNILLSGTFPSAHSYERPVLPPSTPCHYLVTVLVQATIPTYLHYSWSPFLDPLKSTFRTHSDFPKTHVMSLSCLRPFTAPLPPVF